MSWARAHGHGWIIVSADRQPQLGWVVSERTGHTEGRRMRRNTLPQQRVSGKRFVDTFIQQWLWLSCIYEAVQVFVWCLAVDNSSCYFWYMTCSISLFLCMCMSTVCTCMFGNVFFLGSTWEFYHGSSVHTIHKQTSVLTGIQALESATHMANQLSLFSANEEVDEITTTNLKWGEPVTFDSTFGVNRCHCFALCVFVLLCCQVRPVTECQWNQFIVENNESNVWSLCSWLVSFPRSHCNLLWGKGSGNYWMRSRLCWVNSFNFWTKQSLWCNAISLTNNSLHM